MNRKHILTIALLILGGTLALYLAQNWRVLKFKWAWDYPIIWKTASENDTQLLIDLDDQQLESLGVRMTDVVYLPNVHRLHFGVWFGRRPETEGAPFGRYHILLMDQAGREYTGGFANVTSTFEVFQYRWIEDVDLAQVEQLTMYVYPLRTSGQGEIVRLDPARTTIYTEAMWPLQPIGN